MLEEAQGLARALLYAYILRPALTCCGHVNLDSNDLKQEARTDESYIMTIAQKLSSLFISAATSWTSSSSSASASSGTPGDSTSDKMVDLYKATLVAPEVSKDVSALLISFMAL
jgi:hypothetical protein